MTPVDVPREGRELAQDLVDDLLRSNVHRIGPFSLNDDDEPEVPLDGVVLSDWCVVMQWVDPETGGSSYVRLVSRGLSRHATVGLLQMFSNDVD